ncbi:MAG TPA: hypothetical protein VFZ53_10420 [Polyangiaceae bacterium]
MTVHDVSDDELAARLIRAGIREAPPRDSLQKTLLALGLGASALGTAGSAGALGLAKASVVITAGALVKWAGAGAVAGLALAVTTHAVYRATRTESSPASLGPAPLREASRVPELATSVAVSEPVPAGTAPSLAPPAVPRRSSPPAAESAEAESPLAAEIAFVDAGREAYQRGDAAGALGRLDAYERMFPHRHLLPEVLYLRMQSLRRNGETEHAMKLAERLVRDFPNNPHASSAQALLRSGIER